MMKTVFITGGSSGVGRLTALTHAARGDRVFAAVRRSEDADALRAGAKRNGGTIEPDIMPVIMDVTDPQSVADAIAHIRSHADRLDVVSSIAGISAIGALEDCDDAHYRHMMDVNFHGPLRVARAVLPWMREAGGGRLLFMSSLAGRVSVPGESAYVASKHALEGAVESLMFELERFHVQVGLVESSYHTTPIAETVSRPVAAADSPYRPLMEHLADLASASIRNAPDPQPLADTFHTLAHAETIPLRTVVGERGAAIDTLRRQTGDAEWADITRTRTKMAFWRDPPEAQ